MRLTMVALIALAAGAFAQGPPTGRGGRGRMGFDGPGPGGPGGDFGAAILRAGVKNAPFSADVITESSHTLADGNHIRQTVNAKVYRDSDGRTRREQAINLNGLAPDGNMQQMVFINDPVAGVAYSLNAHEHTGVKSVRNGDGRGSGPRPRSASGGASASATFFTTRFFGFSSSFEGRRFFGVGALAIIGNFEHLHAAAAMGRRRCWRKRGLCD